MILSFCPSIQDHFHLEDKPEARPTLDFAGTGDQSDSIGKPDINEARRARSDESGSMRKS